MLNIGFGRVVRCAAVVSDGQELNFHKSISPRKVKDENVRSSNMSSLPAMPSSRLAVEKPRRKRVLDDKVACEVCHDKSTGKHYGVYVCDGCSGFFKRSVRRSTPWVCRSNENCIVDKASRTECRACRFKKCLTVNMNPEVYHKLKLNNERPDRVWRQDERERLFR